VSLDSTAAVQAAARPRLGGAMRLQWDPRRQQHVLLAPEQVVVLNATGAAIVALCDGQRNVGDIAATLGARFQRPVEADVRTFLGRLAARGLVELTRDP
jgi:pyrroloquinoline quinone biosynthesis protein D